MADRDPWFKFYPEKWRADLELQSCRPICKAALIDIMCLLHESRTYGFLYINGTEPTQKEVAKQLGWRTETYTNAVQELLDKDVLKLNEDGVLYSPFLLSLKEKRDKAVEAGKKGGNPALPPKGVRGGVNLPVKPDIRDKKEENKNKKDMSGDAPFVREFENYFWPLVRKKETKADTRKLFVSLRKKGVSLATLLSGLKEYQRAKADDDVKYLMQPKKFLGPGEHWKEWAEKADVAEDNARRSRDALERREKTVLKRTVQPTNPNPDMAKQLRELAKDLGEGKAIPGEATP